MGQTEVEELHPAVLAEEDVGGLEIPVQDSPPVRVRQPLRHLPSDPQRLCLGYGTVGDALGDVLPRRSSITRYGPASPVPTSKSVTMQG